MRAAALLALTLAVLGFLALFVVLKPPAAPEALELVSSRQCLECHPGVAAEWQESHHAYAFENPEVRKLSNDFRNEECLACHAPRPVFQFELGERVLARAADRALGVDCLSCHALPGGGVATTNPAPSLTAPCRPQTRARLASADNCGACHNQHGTVDQWKAAPERVDGKPFKGQNCLHCHMPEVFREGGRQGADHRFLASHDLESLQKAVEVSGGWGGEAPWVSVTNVGAAHNFPTDERSRAADVQVRWRTVDGWGDWVHVWRMRDPYRDEVDLTNTQLPARETWRSELEPPAGAVRGEARLLYRTNPFLPDDESAEVARVPLDP